MAGSEPGEGTRYQVIKGLEYCGKKLRLDSGQDEAMMRWEAGGRHNHT